MRRNDGGIDISTVGRPGGVPTHIVTTQSAAPGTRKTLPELVRNMGPTVATFDPFAIVGRARKALGRRLST